MHKVECGKCSGTGYISAFAHIAGGSCFTCGGRGYKVYKTKPVKKKKFGFGATNVDTGKWVARIFYVTAKNEKEAKRKIKARLNPKCYVVDTIKVFEAT